MNLPYCSATTVDQALLALMQPLNPAAKADYITYLRFKGMRSATIANNINIPSYEVRKLLRIGTKLSNEVKQLLHKAHITLGHARVIAGMPVTEQETIARKVISQKISVRALEDYKRGSSKRLDSETAKYYQRLSQTASEITGHPLTITPSTANKHAGIISIKYSDLDSFDSVFDRLGISLDNY